MEQHDCLGVDDAAGVDRGQGVGEGQLEDLVVLALLVEGTAGGDPLGPVRSPTAIPNTNAPESVAARVETAWTARGRARSRAGGGRVRRRSRSRHTAPMSAPAPAVTRPAGAAQTWMTAAACADRHLPPPVRAAFTTDDPTPADHAAHAVCTRCPVLDDCADYTRRVQPPAGIWAGHRRGHPREHHDDLNH